MSWDAGENDIQGLLEGAKAAPHNWRSFVARALPDFASAPKGVAEGAGDDALVETFGTFGNIWSQGFTVEFNAHMRSKNRSPWNLSDVSFQFAANRGGLYATVS